MPRRADERIVDPATHPKRYVSLVVAADYLECDRKTLNKLLACDLIQSALFGRRRKIRVLDLVRFQESSTVPASTTGQPRLASRRGVYFARMQDFVKIGVSQDVVARTNSLSLPFRVEPLGFIPAGDYTEAAALERALHERFAPFWHHGEWFRAEDELLAFIQVEAEPWPQSAGRKAG